MSDDAALGYRPCVGLIVTKGDGRVFAGRRNDLPPDDPAAWQLPQGGIDEGEEIVATAHPEFADWRWDDAARLAAHIVPFKREAYRAALDLLTERA